MSLDSALLAFSGVFLWMLRLYCDDEATWSDARWIAAFGLWNYRDYCKEFIIHSAGSIYSDYTSLACKALILSSSFLALWFSSSNLGRKERSSKIADPFVTDFLKPLIFPCRTTHARFFPKKHSFSYSYLLVGIPIGWRGAIGSFLSADETDSQSCARQRQRAWFSVNAEDYLQRGSDVDGLKGKLRSFLASQNEDLGLYTSVYLVTAPRFLGYSFNPASFWYLYDEHQNLKAMIVEVNNTFDERRMYFLKGDSPEPGNKAPITGQPSTVENTLNGAGDAVSKLGEGFQESPRKFSKSWTKDFHVSPFNSRKGSYSLSAQDIYRQRKVDNVITLASSKGHPKLVARIFSSGICLDPSQMSYWNMSRFTAVWWWVGFMTFPRILKEAAKLFFRRKLHVWYRPEVLRTSLGREATNDERAIEKSFRAFLKEKVEQSNTCRPVSYISPMHGISETFYPQGSLDSSFVNLPDGPIEFQVTSPLFYAQLVRFAHLSEFFTTSFLASTSENQTFLVSDPQNFLKVFETQASQMLAANKPDRRSTLEMVYSFDSIRWRFLRWLRNNCWKSSSTHFPARAREWIAHDIRAFSFSALDQFSMRDFDKHAASRYRKAVTKVLASDLIAFGQPALIDAFYLVIRLILLWVFVQSAADTSCFLHRSALVETELVGSLVEYLPTSRTVLGLLGTHAWWALGLLF